MNQKEGEKKTRYFRVTTLHAVREALPEGHIPQGAMIGARRSPDYTVLSYEMTEDCECKTCKEHFDPGSSNGRTAVFEAVREGSIPSPGTKTK